jgi:hypothetical protein
MVAFMSGTFTLWRRQVVRDDRVPEEVRDLGPRLMPAQVTACLLLGFVRICWMVSEGPSETLRDSHFQDR